MSKQISPRYNRVAIIGLGLIGGSLGYAIKRANLADHIVGYASSAGTRTRALERGFIDEAADDAANAVKDADLIILCTPVGALSSLAEKIQPFLKTGATVTDVGSVKSAVVRDVGPHIPAGVHFIPGHPVAGTEESGPDAGFAELFDGRWTILTPVEGSDETAITRLELFWEACGAKVAIMDAAQHDLTLAITSHVPHLIAYTMVGVAADLEKDTQADVTKFAAGGFRDLTRIAASDPTMWRDIFLNNKEATIEMLGRFIEELMALQRAIRWDDGQTLFDRFTRTRAIRRQIIAAGQDSPIPNFGRNPQHLTPTDKDQK